MLSAVPAMWAAERQAARTCCGGPSAFQLQAAKTKEFLLKLQEANPWVFTLEASQDLRPTNALLFFLSVV